MTSATPMPRQPAPAAGGQLDPRGGAQAEPLVRRVVQGERVLGHVGVRPRRTGGRSTAVAHWYTGSPPGTSAGNRTRSSRSCADRAVHVGAELDPVGAVPQQRLLGDPQVAEAELGHQPGARAGSAARAPWRGAAAEPGARALRATAATVPRPSAGAWPYSSWSTSSLPGPGAVRRRSACPAIRVSVPPRAGSASTRNASFSISVPGCRPAQPAAAAPGAGPPRGRSPSSVR